MNTFALSLRSRVKAVEESAAIRGLSSQRIAWFVLVCVSLVNFHLVFDHVFWRDEALPLLLVINNPSIGAFLHAMRYEGTPALWHFLLWLAAKAVPLTPLAAQVIHFAVAEAITVLVLFGLQVPLLYRVIILLQEPFVWNAENVRQYQLAGGLILLFAVFYAGNLRHRALAIALTLALLAQTCLHGAIAASILLGFALLDNRNAWRQTANLIVLGSIMLALVELLPPDDLMQGLRDWNLTPSCARLLYVITSVARNVLLNNALLAAGFLAVQFIIFSRLLGVDRNKALVSLLAIAVCFMGFAFIAYTKISGPRQYWLLTYMIFAFLIIGCKSLTPAAMQPTGLAFTLSLLAASLINYVALVTGEPARLKSRSRDVANYLDTNYPTKTVLSKSEIFEAPVRLYRKTHPPEFALGRQAYVDYTVWNHSSVDFVHNVRAEHIHYSELRSDLARTDPALLGTEPIVIVSGFELVSDEPGCGWKEIPVNDQYCLQLIEVFEKALNENYAIYIVRRANPISVRRWHG